MATSGEIASYLEDIGNSVFGLISARELHINTGSWGRKVNESFQGFGPNQPFDLSQLRQTDVALWVIESCECSSSGLQAFEFPKY